MNNKLTLGGVVVAIILAIIAIFHRVPMKNGVGGETGFLSGGIKTDYIVNPSTGSALTYRLQRRCTIGSASNNCNVQNNSTGAWYVIPQMVITRRTTSTTTYSQFFVSTSTAALSDGGGSFPWGFATTTFVTAPLKYTFATTSSMGTTREMVLSDMSKHFGTTSTVPLIVEGAEYLNCGILSIPKRTGGISKGHEEAPTSTAYDMQTECIFNILATSTPAETNQ